MDSAAGSRNPPRMPTTPDQLLARLAELGIETTTHRHPAVFTVAESKALRGVLPGAHCKSLFLRDREGGFWLVAMLEQRRVSVNALARAMAAPRVSFGSADQLMQHLGVIPGAVTPFGLINDRAGLVTPVLDAAMMRDYALLNFHPLNNAMTTAIRPADLLRFIAACGRVPRLVEIAPLESSPA